MKHFLFALLLFITFRSNSQNLVLNPSFEDTISFDAWSALIDSGSFFSLPCPPWYVPMLATPDYLSSVWGGWNGTYNPFGYQSARTGIGYFGVFVYYGTPFTSNMRENITGILSDSLRANHLYHVSFYLSSAGNVKYFTDDIGAYLSVDSVINDTSNMNLPFSPQVENPQGNFLNDSVNWVLISGYYTATGGEKFITIGNFKDDLSTSIDSFSNNSSIPIAYYYIDDVSVIDCTAAGMEEPALFDLTITNPVSEELVFSSYEAIEQAIVLNLLGEAVVKKQFTGPAINYRMNMANLPKGLYILEAESKDKRRAVRKVMKL